MWWKPAIIQLIMHIQYYCLCVRATVHAGVHILHLAASKDTESKRAKASYGGTRKHAPSPRQQLRRRPSVGHLSNLSLLWNVHVSPEVQMKPHITHEHILTSRHQERHQGHLVQCWDAGSKANFLYPWVALQNIEHSSLVGLPCLSQQLGEIIVGTATSHLQWSDCWRLYWVAASLTPCVHIGTGLCTKHLEISFSGARHTLLDRIFQWVCNSTSPTPNASWLLYRQKYQNH